MVLTKKAPRRVSCLPRPASREAPDSVALRDDDHKIRHRDLGGQGGATARLVGLWLGHHETGGKGSVPHQAKEVKCRSRGRCRYYSTRPGDLFSLSFVRVRADMYDMAFYECFHA